jgi:quercetin dioxygenase-like cupin family protein
MARSMRPTRRRALGIAPGIIILGAFAAVALGSPGSGITNSELKVPQATLNPVHLNSDRVKFQTKGPTFVRVHTLTIAPGGRTGWHHHPGFVLVAVQAGTVTAFDPQCNTTPHPEGTAFVEYGDEPLEVRNLGDKPATVYATYVDPTKGAGAFRIEDPVQDCR